MALQKQTPLEIIHDCKTLPAPLDLLVKLAETVYKKERIPVRKATKLILVSDYKISKLNLTYRGKDRPTDVLSFAFNEEDFLGEIYISLQRARIQADRYDSSFDQEIARLFVHGVLHLIGYDHHSERERLEMESKENRYLTRS